MQRVCQKLRGHGRRQKGVGFTILQFGQRGDLRRLRDKQNKWRRAVHCQNAVDECHRRERLAAAIDQQHRAGRGIEPGDIIQCRLGLADPRNRGIPPAEVLADVAGEHAIAVSLNGPRVELTKRRGAPIEWVALDPTVVDVVTMGIAAKAPHPNAAKLYLNFVLSKEVQEGLLEEQLVKPSGRTDVKSAFMTKIRNSKVQMISVDESLGERWELYEKLFQNVFKVP